MLAPQGWSTLSLQGRQPAQSGLLLTQKPFCAWGVWPPMEESASGGRGHCSVLRGLQHGAEKGVPLVTPR